jgi:hypothetical protein
LVIHVSYTDVSILREQFRVVVHKILSISRLVIPDYFVNMFPQRTSVALTRWEIVAAGSPWKGEGKVHADNFVRLAAGGVDRHGG